MASHNLAAAKRLRKELQSLERSSLLEDDVYLRPSSDSILQWTALLKGPPDTPYEGGRFEAEILLPEDYPMSPPKILMKSKIYHPNIDKLGRICLDILKSNWTPVLQLKSVLLSLQSLLSSPDEKDFLNIEVAEKWKKDPEGAKAIAKEWTKLYAS